MVNGVLWRTRTGSPWRDLPASYGRWKTVYNRHRRWSADGTWAQVLAGLQRGCDAGEETWVVAVDSTVVRAHHHAAGARREPPVDVAGAVLAVALGEAVSVDDLGGAAGRGGVGGRSGGAGSNDTNPQPGRGKPADREALGRSRGGLSTKIHLLADSRCRPLSIVTTAGQRHDSLAFDLVLDRLRVLRPGRGRPRSRPDLCWPTRPTRPRRSAPALRARGIRATIPLKTDQQAGRRGRKATGRLPAFDPVAYRDRNVVERAVNKLRGTRAVATRYDKRDFVYRGTITTRRHQDLAPRPRHQRLPGHGLVSRV